MNKYDPREDVANFQKSPERVQWFFVFLVVFAFCFSAALGFPPIRSFIFFVVLVAVFKIIAEKYK